MRSFISVISALTVALSIPGAGGDGSKEAKTEGPGEVKQAAAEPTAPAADSAVTSEAKPPTVVGDDQTVERLKKLIGELRDLGSSRDAYRLAVIIDTEAAHLDVPRSRVSPAQQREAYDEYCRCMLKYRRARNLRPLCDELVEFVRNHPRTRYASRITPVARRLAFRFGHPPVLLDRFAWELEKGLESSPEKSVPEVKPPEVAEPKEEGPKLVMEVEPPEEESAEKSAEDLLAEISEEAAGMRPPREKLSFLRGKRDQFSGLEGGAAALESLGRLIESAVEETYEDAIKRVLATQDLSRKASLLETALADLVGFPEWIKQIQNELGQVQMEQSKQKRRTAELERVKKCRAEFAELRPKEQVRRWEEEVSKLKFEEALAQAKRLLEEAKARYVTSFDARLDTLVKRFPDRVGPIEAFGQMRRLENDIKDAGDRGSFARACWELAQKTEAAELRCFSPEETDGLEGAADTWELAAVLYYYSYKNRAGSRLKSDGIIRAARILCKSHRYADAIALLDEAVGSGDPDLTKSVEEIRQECYNGM